MPIRIPSTRAALYAWHAAMIRGDRPATHDGEPECGWFKTRLVKLGPWVPARIWCEREIDPATGELTDDEVLRCEVGGERRDPARMWTFLKAIPRQEYDALVERVNTDPRMAATMVPYDLTQEPVRA